MMTQDLPSGESTNAWLSPRYVLAAWREITRRKVAATFLLGVALFLFHCYVTPPPGSDSAYLIVFVIDQIKVFALLLTYAVAERISSKNPDRRRVYLIAVVVGAVAGGVAATFAREILYKSLQPGLNVFPRFISILYSVEMIILGGAAIWFILDRRRVALARARMNAAEMERINAQRRSIESDLQAMQARVEPQFLFNTLAQVGELYGRDVTQAEHMLDELIAYLRAAMPKMRDTSSTLGQEVELVRAYLGIVQLRLGQRLDFAIEAPAEIADVRMPPMMLLPLVDHAITHGLAKSQANGSIRIRTAIVDNTIRLEIADSGVGLLPGNEGEDIAGIRERLAALYSTDASLRLYTRDGGNTHAVMEIPLENAVASPGGKPTPPN